MKQKIIMAQLTLGKLNLISYLLTPWSTVLLKKLTGSQLVKKLQHFMELKGSLSHLQEPATCPYPVADQSSLGDEGWIEGKMDL